MLDIGRGGGLFAEPLARLGATVTGVDAAERAPAPSPNFMRGQSGLAIDYRATSTPRRWPTAGESFDLVLNMEVVEHVDNVPLYMKSCVDLVAPGGLIFTATLNRTLRARALAIFAAENVLRWLPRGTHDYDKFLTPDEIRASADPRNGLRIIRPDRRGLSPPRRRVAAHSLIRHGHQLHGAGGKGGGLSSRILGSALGKRDVRSPRLNCRTPNIPVLCIAARHRGYRLSPTDLGALAAETMRWVCRSSPA